MEDCPGCQLLKDRLSVLERRVSQLERGMRPPNFFGSEPTPKPSFTFGYEKPKSVPVVAPSDGGNCKRCGRQMSTPSSNRHWNGSTARHDIRKEWICSSCDRGSVKCF